MEFGESAECETNMSTTKLTFIRTLAIFVLLALLTTGCGARTITDENGKPLAGVHVVAEWRGEGIYFLGRNIRCLRVETMVTGADGNFDFPIFSWSFNPVLFKRTTEIGYFKAGYELVPDQSLSADPVKMRPFSGDLERRFRRGDGDYSVFNSHSGCPQLGTKLYPLLVAIHADAKQIARTYDQRREVIDFEFLLETVQRQQQGVNAPSVYDPAAMNRASEKTRLLKKEMGINQ